MTILGKEITISNEIEVSQSENEVRVSLDLNNVKKENMQKDAVAFEGILFAIYHIVKKQKCDKKIILDLSEECVFNEYIGKGHLCRFLYRAMRFEEQYIWCTLSTQLKREVEKFSRFLENYKFINNVPKKYNEKENRQYGNELDIVKSSQKQIANIDKNLESTVEKWFAEEVNTLKTVLEEVVHVGDNPVFRQLPVGIFKEKVAGKTRIFTGGKSAIDLWTWHHDTLDVIELKAENKMIGIITEIFFYSNLMYDLLKGRGEEKGFVLSENKGSKPYRGYENIVDNKNLNKVKGIMLADKYHPLVNTEIVEIMNNNGKPDLNYYRASYDLEEVRRNCKVPCKKC